MAPLFSLTLSILIVGLVTLLALKHYEMHSSRVVLGRLRPALGSFFHHILRFFEWGVPSVIRTFVLRVVRVVRERAKQTLAHGMLFFEHVLESALHLMRQRPQMSRGEGVASQFLQEVAAHKQKLLRRAPNKRMILDE